MRKRKQNGLAGAAAELTRYHTEGGIFPFLILLQDEVHALGGLVTHPEGTISSSFTKKKNTTLSLVFEQEPGSSLGRAGAKAQQRRAPCCRPVQPQPELTSPTGHSATALPEASQFASSGHT